MRYIFLALMLLGCLSANAEISFSAYPYAAYTSETRLMAGAFSFLRYNFADDASTPKNIDLLANTIYSQNRQFVIALIPRLRLDDWSVEASLQFEDWPGDFYGIGNSTDADLSEDYVSRQYSSEMALRKRLSEKLSVMALSHIGYHKFASKQSGGILENIDLPGVEAGTFLGWGIGIKLDTTDESYYPESGMKLEGKQLWHDPSIGGDYKFQSSILDIRYFHSLFPKQVLATQADIQIQSSGSPVFLYAELGDRLRAFDSKRFIDLCRISQRIEHRHFPFDGAYSQRLGYVLFAELGQVSDDPKTLRLDETHWSLGAGLRFSILPKERLNLRADLGFGEDSVNLMINAREVF